MLFVNISTDSCVNVIKACRLMEISENKVVWHMWCQVSQNDMYSIDSFSHILT